MAALEILELLGGLAECWVWFALTGSCVVWVVTLGQVWLEDDHPHWAALIGIMLHVVVLVVVAVFFWGSESEEKEKGKAGADKKAVAPAQEGAR
jgi:type VI protein secretion system component VasK